MIDALTAAVRAHSDAVALHENGQDVTYAAYWQRAHAVARRLNSLGVEPGQRVLIALPNSVDLAAWMTGTWLAGAVAVPLHANSSPREIERVMFDCTPRVAVGAGQTAVALQAAAGANCQVVAPDNLVTKCPASSTPVVSPGDPNALATILYTSGTTGQPKGVMLSHANLTANFSAVVAALNLTARDSTLLVLPACYAYGSSVLWTHLMAGGRVDLALDFVFWSRAVDALQSQRVSGFYGVPATFALLVNRSDMLERRWPDLRYLACAGGALPAATVAKLQTKLPAVKLHLMYGQTEATARLSILPADQAPLRPKSIGRGLPGVELTVRDEAGEPAPVGQVGHLVARGPNVMQGYWNDSAETQRVLRATGLWTGDLAYADEQGYLYVVGRAGQRIKFGSHRIHPLEIEEPLHEHPAVAEAAVTGVPDETWGEAPLACVVLAVGAAVQPTELLQFLAERLPRHKLPRHIRIVAEIPKTPAGKIDRAALGALATQADATPAATTKSSSVSK